MRNSVLTAIETGYRLIDTAAIYRNEIAVGNAVRASGVKREELFITTKLWISDDGYEQAKRAFERSFLPAVNQIEIHPFKQQQAHQQFLLENHVQLESWAPLAEGFNHIFQNEILLMQVV